MGPRADGCEETVPDQPPERNLGGREQGRVPDQVSRQGRGQEVTLTPAQEWWTPDQIAESGLPDLPTTKRGVNAKAETENWRAAPKFARRRAGKGGGWEYSWK
ncbi:MAG: hypothetical protein EAZ40_11615, partial [Rhodobacterales bacterium]